jgi:hypothetical protein
VKAARAVLLASVIAFLSACPPTTVPDTTALLSGLSVSNVSLAPAFDPAVTSYAAGAAALVASVSVTPTAAAATSVVDVRVNGGAWSRVAPGAASPDLALAGGANALEVRVTAEDGVTTGTYVVAITRDSPLLPDAAPFKDYVIDGTQLWPDPASQWSWSVTGGPGDELMQESVSVTSFTVSGETTPALTFHPVLCGDYTVHLSVTTDNGVITGSSTVKVRTPGLTVALCWDTTGSADLDLHLHKSGTTTSWFGAEAAPNPDDCFYATATAEAFSSGGPYTAEWGYAASDVSVGSGEPGASWWQTLGYVHNPRVSMDNIDTPGLPEVITLDNPQVGQTFRILVHYYGPLGAATLDAHPLVLVHCAGELVGTFRYTGSAFNQGGGFGLGPMWRVANVTITGSGSTVTGATATELHPPGMDTGAWVTVNNTSY